MVVSSIPPEFQNNRQNILTMVTYDGMLLKYAPSVLQNYRGVVFTTTAVNSSVS